MLSSWEELEDAVFHEVKGASALVCQPSGSGACRPGRMGDLTSIVMLAVPCHIDRYAVGPATLSAAYPASCCPFSRRKACREDEAAFRPRRCRGSIGNSVAEGCSAFSCHAPRQSCTGAKTAPRSSRLRGDSDQSLFEVSWAAGQGESQLLWQTFESRRNSDPSRVLRMGS